MCRRAGSTSALLLLVLACSCTAREPGPASSAACRLELDAPVGDEIRDIVVGASADRPYLACGLALADACRQVTPEGKWCRPFDFRIHSINGESLSGFRTAFHAVADGGIPPSQGELECTIKVIRDETEHWASARAGSLAHACAQAWLDECAREPCPAWTRLDLVQGIPFRALPE